MKEVYAWNYSYFLLCLIMLLIVLVCAIIIKAIKWSMKPPEPKKEEYELPDIRNIPVFGKLFPTDQMLRDRRTIALCMLLVFFVYFSVKTMFSVCSELFYVTKSYYTGSCLEINGTVAEFVRSSDSDEKDVIKINEKVFEFWGGKRLDGLKVGDYVEAKYVNYDSEDILVRLYKK